MEFDDYGLIIPPPSKNSRFCHTVRKRDLVPLKSRDKQRRAATIQVRRPNNTPERNNLVKEVQCLDGIEAMIRNGDNDSEIFSKNNLVDKGTIGGRDGLTVVNKMLHIPTNTVIAVKTLDFRLEEFEVRIAKQECADLKKWNCPYLTRVFGGICEGGYFSFFLEYLNKGSLADILQKTKVIPEDFLGIIAYQCLKALDYLHTEQEQTYGQLKPSDILMNSNGDVKLADNTSIANIRANYHAITKIEPVYLSPEVLTGGEYTFNNDIWSLGLTLLECALGVYPYRLDPYYVKYIIRQPAPTLPDRFSSELKDFISKCLIKDVDSRSDTTELLNHNFIKKAGSQSRKLFKVWLEQV